MSRIPSDMLLWQVRHESNHPSSFLFPVLLQHIEKDSKDRDWNQIQFSCSVMSDFLQPYGLQHTRLPCPSPTPQACSNSCPSSWWCHPTTSSSVVLFSSRLQSFPASGSFPVSQFFISGGQSIAVSVSVSVPPMNIQDWFPLGLTSFISLQFKGWKWKRKVKILA